MSNIFIGLKKTCLSILETGERDKENETDLKEGGVIEMSTTVAFPYTRCTLSFVLLTFMPDNRHSIFNTITSIRNRSEIIFAQRFLVGVERSVVGTHAIQLVVF